jgi:YVTN family beta-propeller protein
MYARAAVPSGRLISTLAIAFNPVNGKIYAVDQSGNSVCVIDGRTGSNTRVKVGSGPDAVAVNSVTGNVYVANASAGTVSELDGVTNLVTRTFKAGTHPYMLAVNDAAAKVYVSNTFSDSVAEIDLPTNSTRFLKIGSADNIAVDSKRNHVFLIGYEDPNIRILKGAANLVNEVAAHEHLWGMAIDENTGRLYATGVGSSDVFAIDPVSGSAVRIPVGSIPCAVAVNAQTNLVYVANYGDDTVTVIDGKTEKAIAQIPVGSRPQAVAVDARVNRVYVANTHGDSVTVIDGQRNEALGTVAAGRNPYAISAGADPKTVYVANFGEPSFSSVRVDLR